MDVLLTFTGFHDPYFKGLIDQEEQPGPILSLLAARPFDHLLLFDTPSTRKNTQQTREAISKLHQHTGVQVLGVELEGPTNYEDIFKGLRPHLRHIVQSFESASFFIAVSSGTPQMHACLVLMTASGEIPARILHVRPTRFVTKEHPLVSEIDMSSPEFPAVRFQAGTISVDEGEVDVDTARLQLGIVGDHPAMKRALETGAMLAPSHSPILILGETGTGKELFARFVHKLSGKTKELFVAVNSAAIPEELVESLLFGHKKGAFSGAITDQVGKFDVAHKGTLFLDELGDLPLSAQAKLLRVLQAAASALPAMMPRSCLPTVARLPKTSCRGSFMDSRSIFGKATESVAAGWFARSISETKTLWTTFPNSDNHPHSGRERL